MEDKNRILKDISPIHHVSSNGAAVLLFHGDKNELVPLRQSELLVKQLRQAKVPVEFIVKKGAGHGWPRTDDEARLIVNWFDKYLN